jgi:hypothetical protein
MQPTEWAGLAAALTTIFAAHAALVKFLTKHYLSELKPNGGGSVKDKVNAVENKVNAVEEKVDLLTDLVKEAIRR